MQAFSNSRFEVDNVFNFGNAIDLNKPSKQILTPGSIDFWKPTGFEKVCRVRADGWSAWRYSEINHSILYSSHTSWIYLITVNGTVWKIGETGNPLGICESRSLQPKANTTNRLGRYRRGDGTDERCRDDLSAHVDDPEQLVEFWAYECPVIHLDIQVNSKDYMVPAQIHKHTEKLFLDIYKRHMYTYPKGNVNRS